MVPPVVLQVAGILLLHMEGYLCDQQIFGMTPKSQRALSFLTSIPGTTSLSEIAIGTLLICSHLVLGFLHLRCLPSSDGISMVGEMFLSNGGIGLVSLIVISYCRN